MAGRTDKRCNINTDFIWARKELTGWNEESYSRIKVRRLELEENM